MRYSALLAVLVVVGCGPSHRSQSATSNSADTAESLADFLNKNKFSVSGSLVYRGRCESYQVVDDVRFRHHIRQTDSPIEALHGIFADDPKMRVTRDSKGVVRMAQIDVPRDLLDHKFSRISLSSTADDPLLYESSHALQSILDSPEVAGFMKANNIQLPGKAGEFRQIHIVLPDSPPSPHMPKTLENVTLAEALDLVAQTFPTGFWVYEECSDNGNRIVAVRFEYTNVGVPEPERTLQ